MKTREELLEIIKLGLKQREAAEKFYAASAECKAAQKKGLLRPEMEAKKNALLRNSKELEKQFDKQAKEAIEEETQPTLF